ncbi:hypothetical protein [Paraburkholderia sp. HD33-4]|uniref:hypothetical protein n=1 Tax=Paraburkholderia sp. HD33-4 TaxID=2883242 RepID=UPI001F3A7812|nr:hypothetical protein [Paraburkholderia sp. HD33-4]
MQSSSRHFLDRGEAVDVLQVARFPLLRKWERRVFEVNILSQFRGSNAGIVGLSMT